MRLHSSLRRSLGDVFKSGFIVETDGNGVKHGVKMLPEKRTETYEILRKIKACLRKSKKHKQQGSAYLVLLGFMLIFFAIGSVASAITSILPMQVVQEKSNKCIQQQGEPVLVLNSRQEVKSMQCKKDGALYLDF